MTEAKHTPGPWHVAFDDQYGQAVVSGVHTEICTCWHHSVGSIEKQMRANARLIAAAPELLDYLRIAVGIIEQQKKIVWPGLEGAKATIAKARGEA